MRALVTGASGFIGKHLLDRLSEPVVVTRRAGQFAGRDGIRVHQWDPMSGPLPAEVLEGGIDTIFHLAGESVASGRWTTKKKTSIRDSRRVGTANLVRGLAAAEQRPRVLVCSSAVGYYGDRGDEILDESSAPGDDFLAEVCRLWESAAGEAKRFGVRVVSVRTGIVLGRGGAMAKMLLPFKFGLGGRLGNGRQWMPWVHVDDMTGLLLHAATNDDVEGPMNATSPHPVTNGEFTKTLAAALQRPAVFPVPGAILNVFPVPGAILKLAAGEFAEVLLASQRAVPQIALQTGYAFQYPDLRPAIEEILRKT